MDPEVAAFLTVLIPIFITGIVWFITNRDIERVKQGHAKALEEIRRRHGRSIERLRSQLRGEIDAKLASHQARLRVESETRLRLFELGAGAITEFTALMHQASRLHLQSRVVVPADGAAVLNRMGGDLMELSFRLDAGAPLLPPELEVPAHFVREAFKTAIGERETNWTKTREALHAAISSFGAEARRWKAGHWAPASLQLHAQL